VIRISRVGSRLQVLGGRTELGVGYGCEEVKQGGSRLRV
jgi:hypothetical protein